MSPEKIDEFLSNYREYSARCDFLEKEITELERLVDELKKTFVEDNISITQVLTGMPRGSGISDPTGRLAVMAASGYTPDYIRSIENEIAQKQKEYRFKLPVVVFVESWLKVLTPRERFVIEKKTICGLFWRDIVAAFKNEFGEEYSRHGLKNIRDNAITKIHKIAQ